jgi:hypothetical protein
MRRLRGLLRPRYVGIVIAAGLLAGVIGIAVGFQLEKRDGFCASCHTLPESTFVQQAADRSGTAPDLAVSHAQKPTAVVCVDCHTGRALGQHLISFARLAMWDTLKFYTGFYDSPGRTTAPIPNANCLDCHRSTLQTAGFDNHFHNMLGSAGAPALRCIDCHPGHTPADAGQAFIIRRVVYPQCNTCHRGLGKGPTNLQ